jgi:hypothetical protein
LTAPLASLTPGKGSLTVTWTYSAKEVKIRWGKLVEKASSVHTVPAKEAEACSVATPCHYQITGLEAVPYEVVLKLPKPTEGEHGRTLQGTPTA